MQQRGWRIKLVIFEQEAYLEKKLTRKITIIIYIHISYQYNKYAIIHHNFTIIHHPHPKKNSEKIHLQVTLQGWSHVALVGGGQHPGFVEEWATKKKKTALLSMKSWLF